MSDQIDFGDLNEMSAEDFVTTLSGVFERSRWVAERVVVRRMFKSVRGLHQAMTEEVSLATERERQDLIESYRPPRDAASWNGWISDGAGQRSEAWLEQLDDEQRTTLTELTNAYESRFGFPFLEADMDDDGPSILATLERRLERDVEEERREALRQISEIARFRLEHLLRHDDRQDDGG